MTVELEDRLSGLFTRVAAAVVVDEQLDRVVDAEPPTRRRSWLPAVAAAAVVLAGTGAIVALRNDGDRDRTVREQPADPPGPLYVLPESPEEWTVANGSVHTGEPAPFQAIVVGTPSGDGFVDPISIVVVSEDEIDVDETWESIELGSQTVLVDPDGPFVRMVQQRGDVWLTSRGDEGTEWLMARAFGDIELTSSGAATLVPESPLEEIASFRSDSAGPVHTTYFEMSYDEVLVVVETAPHDALAHVGRPGQVETLEPVTVNGTPGWHTSRRDVDGEWHAVGWMATPNRAVFVSAHEPLDVVQSVAESLVIVDEETWIAATGCDCG